MDGDDRAGSSIGGLRTPHGMADGRSPPAAQSTFGAGISSSLLSYLVTFGTLFVTPFDLEWTRHLSPARIGAILAALPASP
jgi:hypothetical protein